MANIPIRQPQLVRKPQNLQEQKAPIPCSDGVSFLAGSFVYNNAGVMTPVPTSSGGAVQVYGWSSGPSVLSTAIPPTTLVGNNIYPFDVDGEAEFEVNIALLADTAPGSAGTGTANVVIGNSYDLVRPASGALAGYQLLAVNSTAHPVFIVTGVPDALNSAYGQNPTDLNGRVRVKIVKSIIQG